TASVTVLAIGPAVSWLLESGKIPDRLTSPTVGLMPTVELKLPGFNIEPEVSVPMEAMQKLHATATPEPALDPPVGVDILYGFRTCPPRELYPEGIPSVIKLANSVIFTFPKIMAPASRSCFTIKASSPAELFAS